MEIKENIIQLDKNHLAQGNYWPEENHLAEGITDSKVRQTAVANLSTDTIYKLAKGFHFHSIQRMAAFVYNFVKFQSQ